MVCTNGLPRVSAGSDIADQTWKTPVLWHAVNATLGYLIDRYGDSLAHACLAAKNVKNDLLAIFPLLDSLCRATCPACQTPCCRVADACFDLRDLIFIHLINAPVPLGQPRGNGNRVCRYLGSDGCRLPRLSRPWICTWYLCPKQKALLGRSDPQGLERLQATVSDVKTGRREMENRFIEVLGRPAGG